MEAYIQVTNATKRYGRQSALCDVTIAFEEGKIHGIIGRNGSGKTVLFKTICGLVPLSSGQIAVRGRVLGGKTPIPESIGAIINEPGFFPTSSGYRNLAMIAGIKRIADRERIHSVMSEVGLDPTNRKWVSKYSMGMRQRLGLAQAIMEDPDLLILDEPMNGLDNAGVRDMRTLFLGLKARGKTILLASHNREDIEVLCDTVCEMDAGRLTRVR